MYVCGGGGGEGEGVVLNIVLQLFRKRLSHRLKGNVTMSKVIMGSGGFTVA